MQIIYATQIWVNRLTEMQLLMQIASEKAKRGENQFRGGLFSGR